MKLVRYLGPCEARKLSHQKGLAYPMPKIIGGRYMVTHRIGGSEPLVRIVDQHDSYWVWSSEIIEAVIRLK